MAESLSKALLSPGPQDLSPSRKGDSVEDSGLDVYRLVREKKESYRRYNFERLQEEAFATFFDLAQEYTSLDSLYQIAVAVPREFFEIESALYVVNPQASRLEMVSSSLVGLIPEKERRHYNLKLAERPYETDESLIFPVHGNKSSAKMEPVLGRGYVLGLFEVISRHRVDVKKHFFLEKFSNRIGYNLHHKLLFQQNINHIKFINQLVADIEHNVISPNLYYKLFLIRLKKSLNHYEHIHEQLMELVMRIQGQHTKLTGELCEILQSLVENNQTLSEEWKALSKHYEHTSLFLETLLRRDHFEKGTYVLRKQPCNFRTEIIEPLLERYLPLFEKHKIVVDSRLEDVPDEQITLFVDKGLISQVFDNYFSNALKYTNEVLDHLGHPVKIISFNREIVRNYFGEGLHGVRFNFFTTGRPLSAEESAKLYSEGYRAPTSAERSAGSGHGLHFVRNVVEIHGGRVGCEPQQSGNLFTFILPWQEPKT